MSQKPLIVVAGATGSQGGSVANALLDTGLYRVRALTRKTDSDKAKALASKGAEVFKCDLSVKENVKNALSGADIAWIVTNFLDPSISGENPQEEERIGKMIADVAKEGEIEIVIPYVEENDSILLVDVVNDAGPIVAKVIEEGPAKWNGRKVPVAAENVTFKHITDFKWFKEYYSFGPDEELKDISVAKKLHPKIKTFEQYAVETFGKA
ncbi:20700_t:CDS:2 [Rhizophagus irregularis]|nr:20700_t:CDS:2 [Rhizophagus irregularis]